MLSRQLNLFSKFHKTLIIIYPLKFCTSTEVKAEHEKQAQLKEEKQEHEKQEKRAQLKEEKQEQEGSLLRSINKAEKDVIEASKEAQISLGILDGTITKETHPHIDIERYKKMLSVNLADPESIQRNYDKLKEAHDKSGGFYW
jgi:hypothetical protein